jgi:hypothetical protein
MLEVTEMQGKEIVSTMRKLGQESGYRREHRRQTT